MLLATTPKLTLCGSHSLTGSNLELFQRPVPPRAHVRVRLGGFVDSFSDREPKQAHRRRRLEPKGVYYSQTVYNTKGTRAHTHRELI